MKIAQQLKEWSWTIFVCYLTVLAWTITFAFTWQALRYGIEGWCMYFIENYVVWYVFAVTVSYFTFVSICFALSSIRTRRTIKITKR